MPIAGKGIYGGTGTLDTRITDLEDTYVKSTYFEQIDSGTTGTIAAPVTGATFVMDEWSAGVDAIVSQMDSGKPTFESPVDASGIVITTTFNAAGEYALSSTPDAYPVALIYVYRCKLINFDDTKSLFESESLTVDDLNVRIYDTVYDVRDGFDAAFRNGFVSGCVVTDLGGLNISWTAGTVYVDGSLFTVNLAGSTGLTDNATNYLYASKDDASLNLATSDPGGEYALRGIYRTYGGDIIHPFTFPDMSGGLRQNMWKFIRNAIPIAVNSGCACSIDTDVTNANDFKIGTGSYYLSALDIQTIASIIYSAGAGHGDNNVTAHYHAASAWTTGAENGVNFAQWDNGTAKANTAANKWYCGFVFVKGTSTPIYVYPQTQHDSESDALAEDITYPPYHQGVVLPVARFILRHGEAAFSSRAYFVDIRPFFATASNEAYAQNIYQTVTGDSGSTTATASDDSIAITGTAPISTTASSDALDIAMPAATDLQDGYATSTQIGKLDGIAVGADVTGSNAPQAHSASHEDAGGDEINVVGLLGLLADDQHVLDAEVLAVAAAKGVNADITSMTGLDDNGIPVNKVAIATKTSRGSLEIATNTEVAAFESETLAVTPEGLGYALADVLAYGVDWDEDDTSPTLTRTGALAGIAAASSPGNTCLPVQAAMRRCILSDAGEVQYYLGATDSTKKEDMTTASVLDGTDGQVMVEIPKFYYKYSYVAATNAHSWSISAVPLAGYEPHPAFYKDGAWVDHRYIGAYEGIGWDASVPGYIDHGNVAATGWSGGAIDLGSDKLSSVSGKNPVTDETRAEFRAIALNRGVGWRQQDFYLVSAIQLLYLTEYASFDSQSMIGMGRTQLTGGTWVQGSYIKESGLSNSDGNATNAVAYEGDADDVGAEAAYMTYRGIENFYGNIWKWVDGFNIGIGGGTHDGANNQAIMTDSGESLPVNGLIGATIKNTTDGSEGTITANDGTTITATLAGGTDNDWDTGDTWEVNGIPYVSNTETDFADDTATNYYRLEDTGGAGITLPQGSNDYQSTLEQIKDGFLPSALDGSSSTYITDYYYQNTGWRVSLLGGSASYGLVAGVACWYLAYDSARDAVNLSGRVAF